MTEYRYKEIMTGLWLIIVYDLSSLLHLWRFVAVGNYLYICKNCVNKRHSRYGPSA